MSRAIFIDRDGVINDNGKGYTNCIEDFHILPKVKDALILLKQAGFKLIIITNQGGISKGFLTEEDLAEIHTYMLSELPEIDDINYCIDYDSFRRKPNPGMIYEMAIRHDINIGESWFVGDMQTDVLAGINAGCKGTALVINDIQESIKSEGFFNIASHSLYDSAIQILKLEGYLV